MISPNEALVLLILTFPIVIWASWSDLKSMTIPNKVSIALFALFVVTGLIMLPLPEFGIRLLQGAVILAITFVATIIGAMGGGDAKLFAAIAPFVALGDAGVYIFGLAGLSLAAVAMHRLVRAIPFAYRYVSDWKSFNLKRVFPFGLPLATSLSLYFLFLFMR